MRTKCERALLGAGAIHACRLDGHAGIVIGGAAAPDGKLVFAIEIDSGLMRLARFLS